MGFILFDAKLPGWHVYAIEISDHGIAFPEMQGNTVGRPVREDRAGNRLENRHRSRFRFTGADETARSGQAIRGGRKGLLGGEVGRVTGRGWSAGLNSEGCSAAGSMASVPSAQQKQPSESVTG